MRLAFEADDEAGFEQASRALIEGLAAWADRRDVRVDGEGVEQVLGFKFGHLDGHLGRWRVVALEEILLDLFPGLALVEGERVGAVVPSLNAFLDYLAEDGLLHEGSDPLDELHGWLDGAADEFTARMRNPERFSEAKAWYVDLVTSGVDITDPAALLRWSLAGAARADHEQPAPPPPAPSLPPIRRLNDRQLAAAAARTQLMRWLRGFVEFVGEGRRLTRAGNLTVADGVALAEALGTDDLVGRDPLIVRSATDLPQVRLVFELAVGCGLVAATRTRVTRTEQAAALLDEPVGLWGEALQALVHVGMLASRYAPSHEPWWVRGVDNAVVELLMWLYRSPSPVPVGRIAHGIMGDIVVRTDPDLRARLSGLTLDWFADDVERLIDQLALAGAVERSDGGEETDLRGRRRLVGGAVSLSALCANFVRVRLLDEGIAAPALGDLADRDGPGLLAGITGYEPEHAEAEVRRWMTAHGPDAGPELVAALAATDDVRTRALATWLLAVLPDTTAPAVRSLLAQPTWRPYALTWLIARGLEPPTELSADDIGSALVDNLAVMLETQGPEATVGQLQAAGPDDAAFVDTIASLWRIDNPLTAKVLDTLADHLDPTVARTARRARYKHRSIAGTA